MIHPPLKIVVHFGRQAHFLTASINRRGNLLNSFFVIVKYSISNIRDSVLLTFLLMIYQFLHIFIFLNWNSVPEEIILGRHFLRLIKGVLDAKSSSLIRTNKLCHLDVMLWEFNKSFLYQKIRTKLVGEKLVYSYSWKYYGGKWILPSW
jgi:hypothetical protein